MRKLINLRENARSQRTQDALYRQVNNIPTYRKHRQNMRPWDRSLPPTVEQEMTKRQMWELFPPSRTLIIGLLFACLIGVVLAAIIPALVNYKRINQQWRDIEKPEIIYHEGRVLFAVYVVVHVCTGLSWWFVWLARGFDNHLRVMAGLSLLLFLECIWLDVIFYTYRVDITLAIWIICILSILWTQAFMIKDKIEIGALFMIPHLALAIAVVVYVFAFVDKFGGEWRVADLTLDQRGKLYMVEDFFKGK